MIRGGGYSYSIENNLDWPWLMSHSEGVPQHHVRVDCRPRFQGIFGRKTLPELSLGLLKVNAALNGISFDIV